MHRLNHLAAVIFALTALLSTGCLETRSAQKEQEEKQVLRKQINTLQQNTADTSTRYSDLEDESRKLAGRIEAVESRLQQSNQRHDATHAKFDARFKENSDAYREEFNKLSTTIVELKTQIASLQEEQKRMAQAQAEAATAAAAAKASAEKNPLASAEEKFEKKKWQEAILDYNRYRKANPKGKSVPMATLKIAMAFEEMGELEDARTFYDAVISQYPNSKEADKATARKKALGKKKKKSA